jgi:cysteine desulfurase
MSGGRIYLDHAATTHVLDEVIEEMLPFFKDKFHNPSASYAGAYEVKERVEEAREKIANFINAEPNEIVFTSGGTEANNFALIGLALANAEKGKHIVVSRAEHHSILNAARYLQMFFDFSVTFVPIDKKGFVDPGNVEKAITDETTVVSVIHANYEIGSIEPIEEIAKIAKQNDVRFHTDAVATACQLKLDVKKLGVDALTLSAHTIYGPKGVGALYVREDLEIVPLIYGGVQEEGRRGGTENVPAIIGFGKACEIAEKELNEWTKHYRKLRDKIVRGMEDIDGVELTGTKDFSKRLPNHASFVVKGVHGEAIVEMLDSYGIDINTGSVCVSKAFLSSPILLSMGYKHEVAQGSILFTVGIDNSEEDVDYLLDVFPRTVKSLRSIIPR